MSPRRHAFRGQTASRARSTSGFSQATTRRPATAYDQHGRPWFMSLDNKNGRPVGLIAPVFRAPWVPDQQYLVTNPDNIAELYIDYAAMLLPRRAAAERYHKTAVRVARDKKLPVPTKGEYSQEIRDAAGNPPRPIELVIAAMQENPWVLGETETPDPRLAHMVEKRAFTDVLDEYDFGPRSFAQVQAENPAPRRAPKAVPEDATMGVPATDAEDAAVDAFDAAGEPLLDATGEDTNVDSLLDELDEEFDAAAQGGKRVDPRKTSLVAKQAPRRPGQSVSRASARKAQKGKRPTLADGAMPVIGD